MLFRLQPEVLVLLIPVLLFALVFHEFSHAWVANKLGDPTARYAGRLTLNPMAHLDPIGGPVSYTHLTLPTICSV